MKSLFLEQFKVHSKTVKNIFLIYLCSHMCTAASIINIPQQSSTFVTAHELTLTHHNHSKSIVYLMVHSWCCAFYGFGQIYKYRYPSLQYPAKYFHCPKKSSVLCCSISYIFPTMSKHWSVHCFHSVYCLCCKVR